jgi:Flp pilus assembly protein protease CpaA
LDGTVIFREAVMITVSGVPFSQIVDLPLAILAYRVSLSAMLVWIAVWNAKTGDIPNWGIVPFIFLGLVSLAVRLLQHTVPLSALWLVGIGWVVCLVVWRLRVFGGGDMRAIMGLLAFFPDLRFVWILLGVLFVGSWIVILKRQGVMNGLRRQWALFYTVFVGRTVPRPAEIAASCREPGGVHRYGYMLSLAGVLFLWLA